MREVGDLDERRRRVPPGPGVRDSRPGGRRRPPCPAGRRSWRSGAARCRARWPTAFAAPPRLSTSTNVNPSSGGRPPDDERARHGGAVPPAAGRRRGGRSARRRRRGPLRGSARPAPHPDRACGMSRTSCIPSSSSASLMPAQHAREERVAEQLGRSAPGSRPRSSRCAASPGFGPPGSARSARSRTARSTATRTGSADPRVAVDDPGRGRSRHVGAQRDLLERRRSAAASGHRCESALTIIGAFYGACQESALTATSPLVAAAAALAGRGAAGNHALQSAARHPNRSSNDHESGGAVRCWADSRGTTRRPRGRMLSRTRGVLVGTQRA